MLLFLSLYFSCRYPSDADKHLLARQTGLSRNQVSNWFINARVRLWKPMVEEMYQQESKEEPDGSQTQSAPAPRVDHHDPPAEQAAAGSRTNNMQTSQSTSSSYHHRINNQQLQQQQQQQHNPQGSLQRIPETEASTQRFASSDTARLLQRASNAGGDDPSLNPLLPSILDGNPDLCGPGDDLYSEFGAGGLGPAARMRLGTAGDVSLTLGLRHAGNNNNNNNAPEKNRPFSIRDFGG